MRRYTSRLAEVEEKKSIRSAFVFGGLTILILVGALVFGFPLFSKFIGLFSKSPANITTTQTTTVLAPTLATLPKYTNQQTIVVKGTASANTNVTVFFNNSSDQTISDDSGNFSMNVGLTKGANTIYAKASDDKGNMSNSSNTFTVNFSTQQPNLTVNVPQNNQTFYGSTQKTLNIQGSTDANNSVTVNDHIVILDNSGKFSYPFDLQSGDNQLKIVSTDQAGNKKEIDLKVTFNP